jgi:hypothetical protein
MNLPVCSNCAFVRYRLTNDELCDNDARDTGVGGDARRVCAAADKGLRAGMSAKFQFISVGDIISNNSFVVESESPGSA